MTVAIAGIFPFGMGTHPAPITDRKNVLAMDSDGFQPLGPKIINMVWNGPKL